MHRRDFLRMRIAPEGRTLELSCRELYLRIVNAEFLAVSASEADDVQAGEPAASHDYVSIDAVVTEVEGRLREADVVRLIDDEWMASTELRQRVDPLLSAFRARGGSVISARG